MGNPALVGDDNLFAALAHLDIEAMGELFLLREDRNSIHLSGKAKHQHSTYREDSSAEVGPLAF